MSDDAPSFAQDTGQSTRRQREQREGGGGPPLFSAHAPLPFPAHKGASEQYVPAAYPNPYGRRADIPDAY